MIARLGAAAAAVLLGSACATLAHGARAAPCETGRAGELILSGETNAEMLACVAAIAETPVRRVMVDSPGGPVLPAMEIADLLSRWRPEVVVRRQCNSSCANYILPVAGRISLAPGAVVLLHGSIDDNIRTAGGEREYERQLRFARRHRVPLGWLLFRTRDEQAQGGLGAHVDGRPGFAPPADAAPLPWRQLLVEEDFIRSCLDGPAIAPFEGTGAQRARRDARYRARLERQGIHLTGTLRCKPSDGSD